MDACVVACGLLQISLSRELAIEKIIRVNFSRLAEAMQPRLYSRDGVSI